MRKYLLAAAATLGALGLASSAGAATVIINSSHVIGGYTVHISGAPYPDVYEGPEAMNISINGGSPQNITAFCVDLFHLWTGAPPVQTYVTAPVTDDSSGFYSGDGNILPDPVSAEIGYLAGIGQTTTDVAKLAGIQGAIWAIEYPSFTVSGGSSYLSSYVTLANTWGTLHPNFHGHANGIYSVGGSSQGFGLTQGFTSGGVPEPATWVMMIGGFGLAGAALRRRRAAAA